MHPLPIWGDFFCPKMAGMENSGCIGAAFRGTLSTKGVSTVEITKAEYQRMVAARAKKSPVVKDCALAFLIGGAISTLGQVIVNFWGRVGLPDDQAATAGTMTLIFLSVLLTGLGLYSRLARYGGAGTLVPVTGFANAMASPAIDFRTEGLIMGLGARIFTIAGPVLVYGTAASVVYGVVLWVVG